MKTKVSRAICLMTFFWIILIILPASLLATHPFVPVETIDEGEISFYRYGDPTFTGADLLITNQGTWEWFWRVHTSGIDPAPPLPEIDFETEMVIVAILGFQPSGGGPRIEILAADLDHDCGCLRVTVEDDPSPGPLDVITNPYHIVKQIKFFPSPVLFEHQKRE